MLPGASDLASAHMIAQRAKATARPPDALIEALSQFPLQTVQLVCGHGDLNIRNIFVRRDSTDVILIDFAKAGEESPTSRDPANLDVSLALDPIDGLAMLDGDVLRRIYGRPLLPLATDLPDDSRIEAIRQLRREVSGDGISEHEYEVAIACYLLRFAKFEDHGDFRGIAYELAESLI